MTATFVSSAIVNTGKTFQYRSNHYRYFLHADGPQGTRAHLQVKTAIMERFIERVGAHNCSKLPQLMFTQSGGGWYLITVLDERDAHVVSKFLARFNKWMNKRAFVNGTETVVKVEHSNSLVVKYRVEAPSYRTKVVTADTEPVQKTPSAGVLRMVASLFNADHHRQRHHH